MYRGPMRVHCIQLYCAVHMQIRVESLNDKRKVMQKNFIVNTIFPEMKQPMQHVLSESISNLRVT